jgi:hypothetical protein
MTTDGSLRECLQRVFAHTYSVHDQLLTGSGQLYGCPLGNLALELGGQDPVVRQKLHAMFSAWACVIERSLREAMASGALPALDPVTTAQTVVAYCEGVMMLAKTQQTPEVLTQLAHGAVALVEAAAGASLSAEYGSPSRRIGASSLTRGVPRSVASAIRATIDQRRRDTCHAGMIWREVPCRHTGTGKPSVRSIHLC